MKSSNSILELKCSFCSDTTENLTKCKYCYELFCKDHIEPKTMHDFLRSNSGHHCTVYAEQLKKVKEREELQEKIKKDRVVKLYAVLASIIVLLSVASIGSYYFLDKNYSELKEEKQNLENGLATTQTQLENTNSQLNLSELGLQQVGDSLQENTTELQNLKSGDKYDLHDPLYSEVTQFIQDDNSNDEKTLLDNAKSKGLRCAYVEVGIIGSTLKILGAPTSGGAYPLIAFNTIDKGMVYFECKTDYRVFPEVGKKYVDCVEGSPYSSGFLIDDTITKITVIW